MTIEKFLQKAVLLGVSVKVESGDILLQGRKIAVDSLVEEANNYKIALLQASKEKQPYINARDDLIIPLDSDAKYHYWAAGQSLNVTLTELKASREIWNRYVSWVPYWQDVDK